LTRRAALLGLVTLAVACGGPERADPEASVVEVAASGCRRTWTRADGIVVADDLVATVAHAIAGESEVRVKLGDGRELPGTIAAIDTGLDAAVVRVDGLGRPAIRRRAEATEPGEPVTMWTADDGLVEQASVEVRRQVTVRTTDIYRDGEHLRPGLELRADVDAGDSGGGLLDDDDQLVGIVWARSRERDDRAWAMPIAALDPLLAEANSGEPAPPVDCAR
jgi:S1-C subfamily serine protease